MQQKFQSLRDYQCTFESYTARDEESRAAVFSFYFKKPEMIRMEILEGKYPGSVMLYNPQVIRDKVRVQVGNPALAVLQKIILGEYFELHSKWTVDLRGKGVHESSWSTFIEDHRRLLHLGNSKFMGEKEVNGKTTLFYRLESHDPNKTLNVKTEEVWIDKQTYFPIKFIHYDASGRIIRRSEYHNLKFNTGLRLDLFKRFKTDSH